MRKRHSFSAASVLIGASLAAAQTPPPRAVAAAVGSQQLSLQRQQQLRELDQFNIDERIRANSEVPVGQRVLLDYGAFVTLNYLSVDDVQNNNHVLREYDLVGYTRLNIDGVHEFFIRGRTSYNDYAPGDSFDGFGSRLINPDVDRAYYRFDLARALGAYQGQQLDGNLVIQGGRDLVYWQNGLVLGQVLDGVIIDVTKGAVTAETIAGITPTRTVDFDSSRPSFDHNTRRGFYGEMITVDAGRHKPFVYGLFQQDYNSHDEATIGSIDTKYQYNSYYIGTGSTGSLSDHIVYGLEAVYEGGSNLSNPFKVTGAGLQQLPQQHDEIQAWGADARLEYLLNDTHKTRFAFEEIIGSGDSDRGDSANTFNGNRRNTKDTSFNAFGLVNEGLAFAPSLGNISITRCGVSTFPLIQFSSLKRLQLGVDFLLFNKVSPSDAIDEASDNNRFLGWEPDIYVNWQITSDLTLALRYGCFFPDHALLNDDDARQYIYGGLTFAF